jgi:peptidoglycan-associated lipoprotein
MAMTRTKSLLAATSVVALLAGCEETLSNYGEAGSGLDQGSFGEATANNAAYHTGEKIYVIDLAERFAREVPDTVNFAFNSATLDPQARAALDRQAAFIRKFPEVRFRVYGHTDLVGSPAYNRSLGLRRAQAVVSYLSSRGIGRARLEAVVSYGETRPVVNTQDRERRNRRTVTEVSGFVQDHPLILNGKYAEVIWRGYVESATECPPSCGGGGGLLDGGGGG